MLGRYLGRASRRARSHRLSDEGIAVDAEVRFPGAVCAEVLAVARLEENGNGQGLDQLLRDAQRLGALLPDLLRHPGEKMSAQPWKGTPELQGRAIFERNCLRQRPVFGGLDAVALTDGRLGPALEALEHDFGFRCGVPLPARHEFRPPFQTRVGFLAPFSPAEYQPRARGCKWVFRNISRLQVCRHDLVVARLARAARSPSRIR